MKAFKAALSVWAIGALVSLCVAHGQEAAEKIEQSGYKVLLDLVVDEAGAVESATVAESCGFYLDKIARQEALRMKRPVRSENGQPVKYHASVPIFFPVKGDGGIEAQKGPMPVLKTPVMPTYPREMLYKGKAGGAIVQMRIDKKGRVRDVKVIDSSVKIFGDEAVEAVRQWEFKPAMLQGKPVEVIVYQSIAFVCQGMRTSWKWYAPPRPCLDSFEVEATSD